MEDETKSDNKLFFIYDFSNGFAIRRGLNVWLYIGYGFLLVRIKYQLTN